ncbi:MAG: hypothetical protein V3V14_14575 [Saprospiraceae bacterium]
MKWKDFHIILSNIIGFTLLGLLLSTISNDWWQCGNEGEKVLKAWIYGTGGFGIGIISAVVSHYYNHHKFLQYFTEFSLRFFLIIATIKVAMIKYFEFFYRSSIGLKETKIGAISKAKFANLFLENESFQTLLGAITILGLGFLVFQNTKRLGHIILGGLFLGMVSIHNSFSSCYLMRSTIYLSVIGYFIINDLPSYFSFFSNSNIIANQNNYHPIKQYAHLYKSINILKGFFFIGIFFFYYNYIQDNLQKKIKDSPIAGVWQIDKVKYLASDVIESKKIKTKDFDTIIFEKGNWGALKISDTLSYFKYIINPEYNQLEFWNFTDFRAIDLKGKYYHIGKDSMIYKGINNQDSLIISFKLQKDYNEK